MEGGVINRAWRTLATGLCFLLFGLAAALARITVFPLLPWVLRRQAQRTRWSRWFIRHSFGLLIAAMSSMGIMTYSWRGRERLNRQGLLILANHPCFLDVVFLMAVVEHADCIVKAALTRNPFTRSPIASAGFVCNDAGPALLEACVGSVQAGNNLIIFPEGTRTPRDLAGKRPSMQRGAAQIAIRGGLNVTPVRIQIQPLTLGKGDKWYDVPQRRWHIAFDVGEDIDVCQIIAATSNEALAARRLNERLLQYFFPVGDENNNSLSPSHTVTSPQHVKHAA